MPKANKFANALAKKEEPAAAAVREAPSRRGSKHVGGYFAPEVARQLRRMAVDEDTSIQNLLAESLNLLFQSRELPTIA